MVLPKWAKQETFAETALYGWRVQYLSVCVGRGGGGGGWMCHTFPVQILVPVSASRCLYPLIARPWDLWPKNHGR